MSAYSQHSALNKPSNLMNPDSEPKSPQQEQGSSSHMENQGLPVGQSEDEKGRQFLRSKFLEKYSSRIKLNIDPQIAAMREQYLSECIDLLLRIRMKQNKAHESFEEEFDVWLEMFQKIDTFFLEKHIAIKIDAGESQQSFAYCWKTINHCLWNEATVPCSEQPVSHMFFSKNQSYLHLIVNKIFNDLHESYRKIQKEEQSPVFSEDSFDPIFYKHKKTQKKYSKCNLSDLLSEKQLQKMRARVSDIKNEGVRNSLLENLDSLFNQQQK